MVISPLRFVVNGDIGYINHMTVNSETTTRKLVSLPKTLVEEIDDFRFRNRITTQSAAIRALIELGLKTDLGNLKEGSKKGTDSR